MSDETQRDDDREPVGRPGLPPAPCPPGQPRAAGPLGVAWAGDIGSERQAALTDHASRPSAETDERWLARALATCVDVARRLGPAQARRLSRQQLPVDPHDDLLVLAARRLLPLPRRIRRPLPRADLPVEARAFSALLLADRRALMGFTDGSAPGAMPHAAPPDAAHHARREADHAAAAMERWVRNLRAARREVSRDE